MLQTTGLVSQEARVLAVETAWSTIVSENKEIFTGVMNLGLDRLVPILETASGSINPLVSPTSLEKNARDRLKATIAAEAIKEKNTKLEALVLRSMREDMVADSTYARKERK